MNNKRYLVLTNSKTLNAVLKSLPERELGDLLAYERAHQARMTIMLRLYGRYNLLRSQRERANIIKGFS